MLVGIKCCEDFFIHLVVDDDEAVDILTELCLLRELTSTAFIANSTGVLTMFPQNLESRDTTI